MIDLNRMVESFLGEAVRQCKYDGGEEDKAVLRFLNDRNESTDVRPTEVLKWLRFYGVLRGLNKAELDAVASVIVEFADARGTPMTPLSEEEIIAKFAILHDKCSVEVHPHKDGKPHDLTSLTSKALWCCYPDAIPLFDSYATRALLVISHLMRLERPEHPAQARQSKVKYLYRLEVNGASVGPAVSEGEAIERGRALRVFLGSASKVEYRCTKPGSAKAWPCPWPRQAKAANLLAKGKDLAEAFGLLSAPAGAVDNPEPANAEEPSVGSTQADTIKYARFVSVWLDLYRRVERTISNDRLDGYPYKVRVFDKILCIIGEPDYGVKMRQPVRV